MISNPTPVEASIPGPASRNVENVPEESHISISPSSV
jgi:hypothetical protein